MMEESYAWRLKSETVDMRRIEIRKSSDAHSMV